MVKNKAAIDAAMKKIGGYAISATNYWTSTQSSGYFAWERYLGTENDATASLKNNRYYVRAVCAY